MVDVYVRATDNVLNKFANKNPMEDWKNLLPEQKHRLATFKEYL